MLRQGSHHNLPAFIIKEKINAHQMLSFITCLKVVIHGPIHYGATLSAITGQLILVCKGSNTAIAIGSNREAALVLKSCSILWMERVEQLKCFASSSL